MSLTKTLAYSWGAVLFGAGRRPFLSLGKLEFMTDIRVSALVFINDDLEVLTVRKRGTTGFMLPGGKPEAGESFAEAAVREVYEELGLKISAPHLEELGVFTQPALNEPGLMVEAHVYLAPLLDISWHKVRPQAEIEQLRWVHPVSGPLENQAPLNTEAVFPELIARFDDYDVPKSLAVYLGSHPGNVPEFSALATWLGIECAQRKVRLVYGGARVGLMGELANAALENGGEVYGVIPDFMMDMEKAHEGLTALEIVGSMHDRKARMLEEADALVALPGGPGTLEEFFEAWTWNYLGLHNKPVYLLNVAGYWNPLLVALESMAGAGFVDERYFESLTVVDDVDQLFAALGW